MLTHRACLASLALAAACSFGAEKLLKPLAGPGAGQAVDGLRASVSMVKSDFGPGESLLAIWQLTNESSRPVELTMDKRNWYDFAFQIRRDGNRVEPLRASARARPDFRGSTVTLEPGQSTKQFIDLTALDWADPKWSEPMGSYEASVIYTPKQLQSGWAAFRITQVGERRVLPPPDQAERIRSLIAQLGSDEFAARDAAHQQLLAIGKPALTMLEEIVATGGDTEAVRRCQRLITEIKARLNPPPPPRPIPIPRPVPQPRPVDPPDMDF